MNSHSPSPSSGRDRATRGAGRHSGSLRYMSELQTEAYLLAREAVRRVQRTTAAPLEAGLHEPSAGVAAPRGRRRLH